MWKAEYDLGQKKERSRMQGCLKGENHTEVGQRVGRMKRESCMEEGHMWYGVGQPQKNVPKWLRRWGQVIFRPCSFSYYCPWPWTTLARRGLPRKPARHIAKVKSVEPNKRFLCKPPVQLSDGDVTCTFSSVVSASSEPGGSLPHGPWRAGFPVSQVFINRLLQTCYCSVPSVPLLTLCFSLNRSSILLK